MKKFILNTPCFGAGCCLSGLSVSAEGSGRYSCTVKCDQCENEATVHEVMIKGGKKQERHLCERCARQVGVSIATNPGGGAPISQLLSQFMASPGAAQGQAGEGAATGERAGAKVVNVCPTCGLGFAQFRNNGLLGCAGCYSAFDPQLTPLLSRAHEGGTHHIGKRPKRLRESAETGGASAPQAAQPKRDSAQADAELERQSKIAATRRRLGEAVASEQYEVAAQLRDELARLEGKRRAKPSGGAKSPRRDDAGGPSGAGEIEGGTR